MTDALGQSMSRPRIVFFGNERLATGVTTTVPTLQGLVEAGGYEVVAVVSHNEPTASRSQRALEVAQVAEKHNIPVLLPAKPADIALQLQELQPDIGVLAAYGKIVPQAVIDIFPHGIINIHPSLLPKHRGPIPIESVILGGETKTGVSIMQLVKEMDAGPVYGHAELELQGDETKQALADQLVEIGGQMIVELLPGILDGSLVAVPQTEENATYDELISKADSLLDFTKPAVRLEREVRAFLEWPKSRTKIGEKDVVVTKAHVIDGNGKPGELWRDGKEFGFYTSGGIFVIDTLKPAGKGEMTAQAFLAGYRV
jgi:methionyl-tRNA formyltransferase